MVLLGNAAKAADYAVTASIPAPIPSGTPVITAPPDGTTISTPATTVSGTCPVSTPPIIISLNDQSGFLGSEQCTAGGSFAIPLTLSPGAHHLTAIVTTITGDNGQTSQPVTITYTLPAPAHTVPTAKPTARPVPSLQIISDTPFLVFSTTTDAVWRGNFAGGTPPYNVHIDWGDGSTEVFLNRGSDKQAFSHHYTQLRSYRVTLLISDSANQSITQIFAAISPATFNNPPSGGGIIADDQPMTRLLYALYFALFFFLLLFWRYERDRHTPQPVAVRATAAKRQPVQRRR